MFMRNVQEGLHQIMLENFKKSGYIGKNRNWIRYFPFTKFRHIGMNVTTKFHWDGFNGDKDINGFLGNYRKNRKFRLKPEPDPEISGCKISGTLAGMFIPSFIGMVSAVTKILSVLWETMKKTGTGSGNMRMQNFRHISRNVHTKFHQDGFRGYKDTRHCGLGGGGGGGGVGGGGGGGKK